MARRFEPDTAPKKMSFCSTLRSWLRSCSKADANDRMSLVGSERKAEIG